MSFQSDDQRKAVMRLLNAKLRKKVPKGKEFLDPFVKKYRTRTKYNQGYHGDILVEVLRRDRKPVKRVGYFNRRPFDKTGAEDGLIGFVHAMPYSQDNKTYNVGQAQIHPNYQRKGLGSYMYLKMLSRIKKQGGRQLVSYDESRTDKAAKLWSRIKTGHTRDGGDSMTSSKNILKHLQAGRRKR